MSFSSPCLFVIFCSARAMYVRRMIYRVKYIRRAHKGERKLVQYGERRPARLCLLGCGSGAAGPFCWAAPASPQRTTNSWRCGAALSPRRLMTFKTPTACSARRKQAPFFADCNGIHYICGDNEMIRCSSLQAKNRLHSLVYSKKLRRQRVGWRLQKREVGWLPVAAWANWRVVTGQMARTFIIWYVLRTFHSLLRFLLTADYILKLADFIDVTKNLKPSGLFDARNIHLSMADKIIYLKLICKEIYVRG